MSEPRSETSSNESEVPLSASAEFLSRTFDKAQLIDIGARLLLAAQDAPSPAGGESSQLKSFDGLNRSLEGLTALMEANKEDKSDDPEEPQKRARPALKKRATMARVISTHVQAGNLVFYKVPKVRKNVEWHEEAEHEHDVDWADLFFDLTYVAAAYRLGGNLKSDVSIRGFCYFATLAVAMIDAWKFKTLHDATFETGDVFHKATDVAYVCTVACAAIFIQPLTVMEDLSTGNAFGLAMSLSANTFVLTLQKLEILLRNDNPLAQLDCKLSLLFECLPRMAFFVVAACLGGIGCGARCEIGSGVQDDLADDDRGGIFSFYYVAGFLFGSHFFGTFLPLVLTLLKARPVTKIPWHTQHIAHRHGEWIMLMIGESILSLILAPVQNWSRYYFTFIVGLVTVQVLQVIHFSSEMFDENHHALSRKHRPGQLWLYILTLYSIALLAFGVGMKALLSSVVCLDDGYGGGDDHRRQRERRQLGASAVTSYSSYSYGSEESDDPYCDSVPNNYSRLLTAAFVSQYACQQVSLLLHGGVRSSMKNLFNFSLKSGLLIVFTKVASLVGGMLLVRWPGDMEPYEVLGIVCVLCIAQGLIQAYENMIKHIIGPDPTLSREERFSRAASLKTDSFRSSQSSAPPPARGETLDRPPSSSSQLGDLSSNSKRKKTVGIKI